MTSFNAGDGAIYGANPLAADFTTEKPIYIAVALGRELRLFNAAGTLALALPYREFRRRTWWCFWCWVWDWQRSPFCGDDAMASARGERVCRRFSSCALGCQV